MTPLARRIEKLESAPRLGTETFAFFIRDDDSTQEQLNDAKAMAKRNGQILIELSPDDMRL